VKRTLLLNGDWQPLNFVDEIRAICLILNGRAELVDVDGNPSVWDGEQISSPSTSFDTPATIRLLTRVNRKWSSPRFRKKVMFMRDKWTCQYCLTELKRADLTIDHVLPSSRGGKTTWKNCVTSCHRCNLKKGDKTPAEAGMKLNKQPVDPTPWHFWEGPRAKWHAHWEYFVPDRD
jgi:5-methylcytosine-specific restriction endonuclease McrA